jgi:hypothetical protein
MSLLMPQQINQRYEEPWHDHVRHKQEVGR